MTLLLAFFLNSSIDNVTVMAAIGSCTGIYLYYRGFRLLERKRLLQNTPTSRIRSAAMGLVELSGLAVGPYTMLAPITGVSCYYYRTMVWQWKQRGKSSEWVKVADESLHVPFFLDDGTGRMLVDPQGAELDIHCDFHEEFSNAIFSSGLEIPSNIIGFLGRHGVSSDKKIKVEEYCIKPKNALFILGTLAENFGVSVIATPVRSLITGGQSVASRMPSLLGGLGQTMSTTATITGTTFKDGPGIEPDVIRLSGSDKPVPSSAMTQQGKIAAAMLKAGITNPAAWAAAGVNPVMSTALTSDGSGAAAAAAPEEFNVHPPVVLMKGSHEPAFFISWRSQRDLVKSLGWKSGLMIWGGPALALVCFYFLASQFGWL